MQLTKDFILRLRQSTYLIKMQNEIYQIAANSLLLVDPFTDKMTNMFQETYFLF